MERRNSRGILFVIETASYNPGLPPPIPQFLELWVVPVQLRTTFPSLPHFSSRWGFIFTNDTVEKTLSFLGPCG